MITSILSTCTLTAAIVVVIVMIPVLSPELFVVAFSQAHRPDDALIDDLARDSITLPDVLSSRRVSVPIECSLMNLRSRAAICQEHGGEELIVSYLLL